MQKLIKPFLVIVLGIGLSIYLIAFLLMLRVTIQSNQTMAWNLCSKRTATWEYLIPGKALGCMITSYSGERSDETKMLTKDKTK